MTIEERTFADMDRKGTGVIDWWEYLMPMCVRKLNERKKVRIFRGYLKGKMGTGIYSSSL